METKRWTDFVEYIINKKSYELACAFDSVTIGVLLSMRAENKVIISRARVLWYPILGRMLGW